MASKRSFFLDLCLFSISILKFKMNFVGPDQESKIVRRAKKAKKTTAKNALAVGADIVSLLGFLTSNLFRDSLILASVSIMSFVKKLF